MSGHVEIDIEIMYSGLSSQMKKSNSDTCMWTGNMSSSNSYDFSYTCISVRNFVVLIKSVVLVRMTSDNLGSPL